MSRRLILSIFLFLSFLVNSGAAQFEYWEGDIEDNNCRIIEQEVECISVCHLDDHNLIIFFWDIIQGEWALLDHQWVWGSENAVSTIKGKTYLSFTRTDYPNRYYYIVSTDCYIESWEKENPLTIQNNRPWFANNIPPGLKTTK